MFDVYIHGVYHIHVHRISGVRSWMDGWVIQVIPMKDKTMQVIKQNSF